MPAVPGSGPSTQPMEGCVLPTASAPGWGHSIEHPSGVLGMLHKHRDAQNHSTSTARGGSLPCHGQGGGRRQPGPKIPLHSRGEGVPSASPCPRHRGTLSRCSSCPAGPRPLWGGTFTSPQHISISSPISGANCLVLWRLTGSLGDSIRRAGSEPRQEVLLFPQGSCEKALPSSPSASLSPSCCLHLISKGPVLSSL